MQASRQSPRIVFVQFTNAAAYPPLEHSSRILAEKGWDVLFLSAMVERDDNRAFPEHGRIRFKRISRLGDGRLAGRLYYFVYALWVLAVTLQWRPHWVYASDPNSCPIAIILRMFTRTKIIYHEHDSPDYRTRGSKFQRIVEIARIKLSRISEICILPQRQRLDMFLEQTQRNGLSLCVPNYPMVEEVSLPREPALVSRAKLTFYYHGSLNPFRLPLTIIDALAKSADITDLIVIGYETAGSIGYMEKFLGWAKVNGLEKRVQYLGTVERRTDLMNAAAMADVGLAFMPRNSDDINMRHMAGASNKPFDYLAAGLMLMVSDMQEWRDMFVGPGLAISCDPDDVESLASAIKWCAENKSVVGTMGERGRRMIHEKWNYEMGFAPVLRALESSVA